MTIAHENLIVVLRDFGLRKGAKTATVRMITPHHFVAWLRQGRAIVA